MRGLLRQRKDEWHYRTKEKSQYIFAGYDQKDHVEIKLFHESTQLWDNENGFKYRAR